MMTVFEHKLDQEELPETIQSEIRIALPSSDATRQSYKNTIHKQASQLLHKH